MEEDVRQLSKLLFKIIKVLYPKYHPFWFVLYMYLIYFRITKRKLQYKLISVPSKFIATTANTSNVFKDINNTLVVNTDNLYNTDNVLVIYCVVTKKYRNVFVVPSSKCKKDEILLNETLYHNLNSLGFKTTVQLRNFNKTLVPFADEIDIMLISSPYDISNSVSDSLLDRYFRTPKLLKKGDIIEIDVKYIAPDLFYLHQKVNQIEKVFYKCKKVLQKDKEVDECCFCVIGETAVKQSVNVQSFIPNRFLKNVYFDNDGDVKAVPFCPYGMEEYLDKLEKSVKPFFMKRKLNLKPIFLLQGNRGCGKETLITSLAHKLGMHFYKINNIDLMANVYAQNETKLKNAFFNAKMSAPCIISIHNFENFGKNNEGQYDERLMGFFAEELKNLFENNPFPVFLFCCSNEKNIPVDLKKLFLECFEVNSPTDLQREDILRWTLAEMKLTSDFSLHNVANKTHGFFLEDIRALVYYAKKDFRRNNEECDIVLNEENFTKALDIMQASYNESLGAPKVPKVEWSDVGGLEDVKEEIIKTINLPLKHPEFLKRSGLKRSGILLFGPPGTGKTLIAKAVATECSLCFLSVKGPELLNMYVGQSEQNIREVFERAREASPCIIFFDELDSLAPNRGISGDSGGVMDRVVSQLLAEMDGLNDSATIFIIGATNRPDLIDPALLRPGRFDKLLYVGPCIDLESKTSVLKALTRKFNLGKDIDLYEVVKICPPNITGADFYGICATAWSAAVRKVIQDIEHGIIPADNVTERNVIVKFEDFQVAIENVKPSISQEDLKYFERLKTELSSNA